MRKVTFRNVLVWTVSMLLVMLPVMAVAETEQAKANPPPVSQPLVSEGDLAVKLAFSLGVGSADDEVMAETDLGDLGIAPRNGWIADYPVTPDIAAEVQQSLIQAVDDRQLDLTRDEALTRFNTVLVDLGLRVRPYGGESGVGKPVSCANYPNPAMVGTAYTDEGPPIVTYYCPPPDYYYMYSWVPYPFWWDDFWFPGFFVLNDFHRPVFVRGHVVVFTNHFNDVKRHHVFRVDPVTRFNGKTFAGIGVRNHQHFISTGVPRSSHVIFNGGHGSTPAIRGGQGFSPAGRGARMTAPGSHGSPAGGGGTHGGATGGAGGGSSGHGGGGVRSGGSGSMGGGHGGGGMRR